MRGRPKGTVGLNNNVVNRRSHTVGNTIRRARIDAKLGLSDVATALGVSLQFISNIERGRAPLPVAHIKATAKFLKLSAETLFMTAFKETAAHKKFMAA